MLSSTAASADEDISYSSSWADLNWSACEGLGVLGSGKVTINASYVERDDTILVKRLSALGTYPAQPLVTSKVSYTDSDGTERIIQMANPWYDVVHEPGTLLVLPQVATSSIRPGHEDSLQFSFRKGSDLNINVRTLFTVGGGSCTSSFSQDFNIP